MIRLQIIEENRQSLFEHEGFFAERKTDFCHVRGDVKGRERETESDRTGIRKILVDSPPEFAGNEVERIENLDAALSDRQNRLGPFTVSFRKRNHPPMVDIISKIEQESIFAEMPDEFFIKIRGAGDLGIDIESPPGKSIEFHRHPVNHEKPMRSSLLSGEEKRHMTTNYG